MSEREFTRVPVSLPDEELAPESIPCLPAQDGEILVFSAHQFDRLNTFKNIVEKVLDAEKDERENGKPSCMGPVKDGKVANPYMRLDSRYRAIWNEKASNLYEQEIMPDPGMKEAADDIVAELKELYEGKPAMTAEKCQELFDR